MMKLLTTVAYLAIAGSASAQEGTYLGTGMSLSQPWGVSVCLNCSDEQSRKQRDEADPREKVSYVYVSQLVCNGPAARAGVKLGDKIFAIDGVWLTNLTQEEYKAALATIIINSGIGDHVRVFVNRESADAPPTNFEFIVPREVINKKDLVDECN